MVEGAAFEMRYTARYQGFESLALRQLFFEEKTNLESGWCRRESAVNARRVENRSGAYSKVRENRKRKHNEAVAVES